MRNRALNYKPSKVGSVTIVDEKPAEIYRQLVGEEIAFTFVARDRSPERTSESERQSEGDGKGPVSSEDAHEAGPALPFTPYEREGLEDKHRDAVLQCAGSPEQLDTRLRRLAELQRTAIEEQGVNTLYLALGFLHYTEDRASTTVLRAPLVLVPVHLQRKSARTGFILSLGEDEPVLNPSLVEYLRRVRGIKKFPALPEVTDDPGTADLLPVLEAIQREVAAPSDWKVTEEIALAPFAFQKLVIYKDLEANEERYRTHPLVRRVALREGEPANGLPPGIREINLDEEHPPEQTYQVVDADSSQVRAIAAVAKGHDLVIHGPPGTGKSQTITNLIAEALGQGQRVLFVAEKMAALEVVYRRLAAAQLGEFCLELHSTKARKGEVLDTLRRALHAQADPTTGVASRKATLQRSRGQLNAYVRAVHTPRTTLALSAFQALQGLASAGEVPKVRYAGDPTSATVDQLAGWEHRLQQLQSVGRPVSPIADNPWRDADLSQLGSDLADDIEEARAKAQALVDSVHRRLGVLSQDFGLPLADSIGAGEVAARAAAHLARATGVPEGVLRDPEWSERPPAVTDLLTRGRQTTALGSRLATRYDPARYEDVTQEDIAYVETKRSGLLGVIALLDSRYRMIRRRWLAMRRPNTKIGMLEQAADLRQALRWQEHVRELDAATAPREWFGKAWRGASSNWEDLEARAAWVEQFHRLQKEAGPFADPAFAIGVSGVAPGASPEEVTRLLGEVKVQVARLRELIRWPEGYLADADLPAISARLAALGAARDRGATWVAFVRAVRDLQDGPTKAVADQVFAGTLVPECALAAFKRSFYAAWLDRVVPTVPELDQFSTAAHEDVRQAFHQADVSLQRETQVGLVARLREMGASRYANAPDKPRQFLATELAKQKRHRPLRVTMREAGPAVAAIAPCFLMSPMSVSQFLGPDQQFDLVIFDEASQLSTEDAIGPIGRGKRLVVVGDPKQLPPTNFFAVQIGASEAVEGEDGSIVYEETESVLEEMQAIGLHAAHLEWHYRSAHQGLIQFSNERFYSNRLVVFPAAAYDGPELGVHFVHVEDGRYEGAGVNPIEAARVAAAVVEHFRTRPELSLGVGTFNLRQQNAIWDALEQYRREDPSLEVHFDRAKDEPFFVKNLENIQGDERDVIFLSITYARQADGRLRLNFGPLNRQEGGRRLNVLVSRARQQMRVFSSMLPGEIDPSGTASPGPALMRDFLAFAKTGQIQTTGASAADADSPFEFEVGDQIGAMGYLVDRQVGVGSYRLDLGVRSQSRPGEYIAGVECDGAAYHSAECARDRDRLRQMVLERRGWTILRVWSTDWFKDRAGTIQRLRVALQDLEQHVGEQRSAPILQAPVQVTPPAAPRSTGGPRAYIRPSFPAYVLTPRGQGLGASIVDAASGDVARQVKRIVQAEGPLARDVLRDRLAYLWGHERVGTRIGAAIEAGIVASIRSGYIQERDGFCWADPAAPAVPRDRSGLGLVAEQVATEELAAAARMIAAAADVIPEEDLVKEIREALGLRRSNPGTVRIREVVQALLKDGQLRHSVHGVRVAPTTTL
jgi:very-short-patch-repair endonuclease